MKSYLFHKKQDIIKFLQKYPDLKLNMDNVLANSFLSFKNFKYSDYISNCNDNLENTLILVDGSNPNIFIGTGQLQHPEIGQGKDGYPYLVNITVNPKYRKQGMGSKILTKLVKKAKTLNFPEVRLTIHYKDLDRFYQDNLFQRMFKPNNVSEPSRENPWYYFRKLSNQPRQTAGNKNQNFKKSIKKLKQKKYKHTQRNKRKNTHKDKQQTQI